MINTIRAFARDRKIAGPSGVSGRQLVCVNDRGMGTPYFCARGTPVWDGEGHLAFTRLQPRLFATMPKRLRYTSKVGNEGADFKSRWELSGTADIDLLDQMRERFMKLVLAILAGFGTTFAIFGGGAFTAIYLAAAPSQNPGSHWNATNPWATSAAQGRDLGNQPTRKELDQAKQAQATSSKADESLDVTTPTTDPMKTAAAQAANSHLPGSTLSSAHIEWCSERYRSYDPSDDSYNSYSGVRRKCIPDFSDLPDQTKGGDASSTKPTAALIQAAAADEMPASGVTSEHVQSCFDRYRSYRPEDNTYQPYGSAPRRQCE